MSTPLFGTRLEVRIRMTIISLLIHLTMDEQIHSKTAYRMRRAFIMKAVRGLARAAGKETTS